MSEGQRGHKRENRGRRPRFPLRGGEEKSPYSDNFSIQSFALLDGERTISLLLSDNATRPALRFAIRCAYSLGVAAAVLR
jgi:hypothetical protein